MLVIRPTIAWLLVAAATAEAANLRHAQRNLQTYTPSDDYFSVMLDRVNQARASAGLPALCTNKKLQNAAQQHSDDEAANNYMDHTGTDGSSITDRITRAGYDWSSVAENVAAGQADVDSVMESWLNSPGHRANILGDYTMFGTAYAYNADSTYKHYWTQDFGTGDSEECDGGNVASEAKSLVKSNDVQDTSDEPVTVVKALATSYKADDDCSGSKATTEAPYTDAPVAYGGETEAPYTGSPVAYGEETEAPCTDAPTEAPYTDAPVAYGETTEDPYTDAPVGYGEETEAPCTDAPTEAPYTDAPVAYGDETEAPCTDAPTEASYTDAPVAYGDETEAPCIDAPTEAPYTDAPIAYGDETEAPCTDAPTEASYTDAPVAYGDETEAPCTDAPTEASYTDAPVAYGDETEAPCTDSPVDGEYETDAPITYLPEETPGTPETEPVYTTYGTPSAEIPANDKAPHEKDCETGF